MLWCGNLVSHPRPGPLKCLCAPSHQILARSAPQKARNRDNAEFATKVRKTLYFQLLLKSKSWTLQMKLVYRKLISFVFWRGTPHIWVKSENVWGAHLRILPKKRVIAQINLLVFSGGTFYSNSLFKRGTFKDLNGAHLRILNRHILLKFIV